LTTGALLLGLHYAESTSARCSTEATRNRAPPPPHEEHAERVMPSTAGSAYA